MGVGGAADAVAGAGAGGITPPSRLLDNERVTLASLAAAAVAALTAALSVSLTKPSLPCAGVPCGAGDPTDAVGSTPNALSSDAAAPTAAGTPALAAATATVEVSEE